MSKLNTVGVLSCVLCLILATVPVAHGGQATLEVWYGEQTEQYFQVFESLAREFENENPGVKVDLKFLGNALSWHDKLRTAIAGGAAPDVAYTDGNMVQEMRAAGMLEPLDAVLGKEEMELFRPGNWVPNAVLEYTYEGRWYGLPFRTDIRGIYVNIDHFEKMGVDPYLGPRTIDDLDALARKVTLQHGSEEPEVIGFFPHGNNLPVLNWMLAFGGQIVDWETLRLTLTKYPKNEATLEWMLGYADRFGPVKRDAGRLFPAGQLAIIAQSTTFLTTIRDRAPDMRWWTHAMPYQKEGSNPTSSAVLGPAIPKGAKNPELAGRFLAYLGRPDVQLAWYRGARSMPTNVQALKQAAAEMQDPREVNLVQQWPQANPRPPHWRILSKTVEQAVNRLLKKEITPPQFLEDMQRTFDDAHERIFLGVTP